MNGCRPAARRASASWPRWIIWCMAIVRNVCPTVRISSSNPGGTAFGRRVEARLADLLEPREVLRPEVAVGRRAPRRTAGTRPRRPSASSPGRTAAPSARPGSARRRAICGIAPSTTARWPDDPERVVAAARGRPGQGRVAHVLGEPGRRLVGHPQRPADQVDRLHHSAPFRRSATSRAGDLGDPLEAVVPPVADVLADLVRDRPHRPVRELEARAVAVGRQPVLDVVDARERHEHRPAQLQERRRLDDLDVPPEVAGVVAEVAIPPPARPRLDHHRERLAARHLPARADLLEHRLERDLDRRGDLDLPGDADGLDFLLDIAHRHAQSSLSDLSGPADRSLALRSARSLMRSSW